MSDAAGILEPGSTGRVGLRIGIAASLLLLLIAFASIVWVPYPIETIDVAAALQDPGAAHWLGTDQVGRDVLSLIMKGMLTSFVVAAIAVVIAAVLGVPLGLLAAGSTGRTERLALGVGNSLLVLPAFVVAVIITTLYGPSALNVMIAIGIANVSVFAKATRNSVRRIRGFDYVAAGRLAGMTRAEAWRHHVMPGLARLLGVQAIVLLAVGVGLEAALSYAGLGTQAPATSLGLMLKDAQTYLLAKPGLAISPGIAIILIVVALSVTGAGLRRATGRETAGPESDDDA